MVESKIFLIPLSYAFLFDKKNHVLKDRHRLLHSSMFLCLSWFVPKYRTIRCLEWYMHVLA